MKAKLILAALFIGLVVAAYFAGKELNPVTKLQTVEVEKIVTETVVERITAPDGTVTEKTTEKKVEDSTSNTKGKISTAPAPQPRPDWRATLVWTPRMATPGEVLTPTGAGVERRILGPVWLGVQGNWYEHSIELTASLEF